MDTSSDSDSDSVVHELPAGQAEEGELSDLDQDVTVTNTNQTSTEEQNYREIMRSVHSYMGWTHIPDIDSAASSAEDNPFAAPEHQPVGKISVNLPTDDWLCRKMDSLNLTLVPIQKFQNRGSAEGPICQAK